MTDTIKALAERREYPGIRKAFLEIAYGHGGINRHRSQKQQAIDVDGFLASRPYGDHFATIDQWLSGLSVEEMQTVCNGEYQDQLNLIKGAPIFTNSLLDEYFEEVC